MGVRIIAKDVDAEAYATEYSSPVRRGLEGIHFLNGTAAKAARNYAPGKSSGVVIGAPAATTGFLSCKSLSNFIQTDIPESDLATVFVIARSTDVGTADAVRPAFYATQDGPGADGAGTAQGLAVWHSGSQVRSLVGYLTPAAATFIDVNLVEPLVANFALYVQVVAADKLELRDVTRSLTASVAPTGTRRRTTNKFRIGSSFKSLGGTSDIAVFQVHSVVLSEAEIAAVVADLRAYAARKGITV